MHVKLSENFRAVFYAPFYATHALGFYTSEGVEVELLNSPAPAAAAAGLLDGSIDLSWGGPMRVMKARDDDPASPLVCFCEVAARDPFFLVGKGDPFKLPARRSAAAEGRDRVGSADALALPAARPARARHRSGDGSIAWPTGRWRTIWRRCASGELDVVQMFEPYVSMALQAGAGDILYAASARGPTVYTTFLATPRQHSPQPRGV